MNAFPRIGLLLTAALAALSMAPADAEQSPAANASSARDGQHDFDFKDGTWSTHIRRLRHPLSGSQEWIELNGTVTTHKVWGGRALLEEVEADGPDGHFEDLGLFLYNPGTHQWTQFFATGKDGVMGTPMFGEFRNGRGEFYDQEDVGGRSILARFVWLDIRPDSHRVEQSFSDDGGKTWESNFVADLQRVKP
ncbi:MAG TPA: hypothetical protein VJX31_02145 [Casimicrobiaceae bacterium]|nr:hypothetical protein [Casimicrobiaceae bacterium]